MTDITYYKSYELVADTLTDLTDGGLADGEAGAYWLNFCNDTEADVTIKHIYVTNGAAPARKDKINPEVMMPKQTPYSIMPFKLGVGQKVFVEVSASIPVQLFGAKED